MRRKNNRISRTKNMSGEQISTFPEKIVVLSWFLRYIHEVRMYELCIKTMKFQFFVPKRRPERNDRKFTGFYDFLLILCYFGGRKIRVDGKMPQY